MGIVQHLRKIGFTEAVDYFAEKCDKSEGYNDNEINQEAPSTIIGTNLGEGNQGRQLAIELWENGAPR